MERGPASGTLSCVTRRHFLIAYVLVVGATPVAVWGLLPDLSEEGGTDRMIEPLLSGTARTGIGSGALAVAVASVVVVFSRVGGRLRRRGDAGVVVPLLLAGIYSSVVYRIATSAVSGANIGGALLMYLGVMLVPSLVVVAAASAWRMRGRPSGA